jgi:hypothetical protein
MLKHLPLSVSLLLASAGCDESPESPTRTQTDAAVRDDGDTGRSESDAASSKADATTGVSSGTADGSVLRDAGSQARDGGFFRPISSFEPVTSISKTPNSSIDLCWGDCPEQECFWEEPCEGRYDDALETTYEYCPANVGAYCLQVCEKDASTGKCDMFKPRTRSYLVDCTAGKPSLYRCGINEGCSNTLNTLTCL